MPSIFHYLGEVPILHGEIHHHHHLRPMPTRLSTAWEWKTWELQREWSRLIWFFRLFLVEFYIFIHFHTYPMFLEVAIKESLEVIQKFASARTLRPRGGSPGSRISRPYHLPGGAWGPQHGHLGSVSPVSPVSPHEYCYHCHTCYWSYVNPNLAIEKKAPSCGSGPLEFLISPSARAYLATKSATTLVEKPIYLCGKTVWYSPKYHQVAKLVQGMNYCWPYHIHLGWWHVLS